MFELQLNTVLSFLNGSRSILIMGYDGIVIEAAHKNQDNHFQDFTVELGQIVKNLSEIANNTDVGALHEMILQFESSKIILRSINKEYFLALLIAKEESIGKSQFAIQRILPDLVKNL